MEYEEQISELSTSHAHVKFERPTSSQYNFEWFESAPGALMEQTSPILFRFPSSHRQAVLSMSIR